MTLIDPIWAEACRALVAETPTIPQITEEIAAKYGVSLAELRGARGSQRLCHLRHLAFTRCKREAGKSLREIAEYFGNRDHTTVHYGIERYEARRS